MSAGRLSGQVGGGGGSTGAGATIMSGSFSDSGFAYASHNIVSCTWNGSGYVIEPDSSLYPATNPYEWVAIVTPRQSTVGVHLAAYPFDDAGTPKILVQFLLNSDDSPAQVGFNLCVTQSDNGIAWP